MLLKTSPLASQTVASVVDASVWLESHTTSDSEQRKTLAVFERGLVLSNLFSMKTNLKNVCILGHPTNDNLPLTN